MTEIPKLKIAEFGDFCVVKINTEKNIKLVLHSITVYCYSGFYYTICNVTKSEYTGYTKTINQNARLSLQELEDYFGIDYTFLYGIVDTDLLYKQMLNSNPDWFNSNYQFN